MLKKIFAAAMLLIALPVVANAYTLKTWVQTVGGNIVVQGGAPQTVTTGAVYKTYTSSRSVTVTATTGYSIKSIMKNGVPVVPTPTSPYTTTASPGDGTLQSVVAQFATLPASLSASVDPGARGMVQPMSYALVKSGKQLSPLNFYFTPYTGQQVTGIDGLAGLPADSYAVTNAATKAPITSWPAGVNVKVKVTFYTLQAGATTLVGHFSGTTLVVANAGPPQFVLPGRSQVVTLSGAASTGPITGYAWTQTVGPETVALSGASTSTATFPAPSTPGLYKFDLTVTGSGATSTATTIVNVSSSPATVAWNQCGSCHKASGIGQTPDPGVFRLWSSSRHRAAAIDTGGAVQVMCYNCHTGALTGGHPGPQLATLQNVCTNCHAGIYFPPHHTTNMANNCVRCHDPHSTAPYSSDCLTCHSGTSDEAPIGIQRAWHYSAANADKALFGQFTGASPKATPSTGITPSYLTPSTTCANCHSTPHPTSILVQQQYAENLHAETKPTTAGGGNAWGAPQVNAAGLLAAYGTDFKFRGSVPGVTYVTSLSPNKDNYSDDCVRCHTTTGFINFVESGYVNQQEWGVAGDKTKEVLTCNACHTDTNGTLRTIPVAFEAYLGYSTTAATRSGTSEIPAKFAVRVGNSSLGNSDICVSCHSYGRTKTQASASVLRQLNTYASYSVARVDVRLVGSHGTAIAAVPFLTQNDYVYRFAGQTYDLGDHGRIGMGDYAGTGNGGPCAGCHLNADKTSTKGGHTFAAWKNWSTSSAEMAKTACNNCHVQDSFIPFDNSTIREARLGAFAAQSSVKRVLRKNLGYPANQSLVPSAANAFRFYSGAAGTTGDFKYSNRELYQGANLNSTFNTTNRQISWYIHGPILAQQLLFDSLDVALHGHLTGSIADLPQFLADNPTYLTADQAVRTINWFKSSVNPTGMLRPKPINP